jgi:hypothetical protein
MPSPGQLHNRAAGRRGLTLCWGAGPDSPIPGSGDMEEGHCGGGLQGVMAAAEMAVRDPASRPDDVAACILGLTQVGMGQGGHAHVP